MHFSPLQRSCFPEDCLNYLSFFAVWMHRKVWRGELLSVCHKNFMQEQFKRARIQSLANLHVALHAMAPVAFFLEKFLVQEKGTFHSWGLVFNRLLRQTETSQRTERINESTVQQVVPWRSHSLLQSLTMLRIWTNPEQSINDPHHAWRSFPCACVPKTQTAISMKCFGKNKLQFLNSHIWVEEKILEKSLTRGLPGKM